MKLIIFLMINFLSFFLDKCSSSVAHLVENELPLASVNVQSSSTFDKRSRSSGGNMTDSQDINEIEVISEHENILNNGSSSDHMYYREKASSSLNVEVEKKSGDSSQNVYSNIPSASSSKSTSNVPNILKNAAADHVYSNIDETVAVNGNGAGARFLSDNLDLDLDDPLLTSSFVKKKEIPNNQQQNVYNTSSTSSHGGGLPNANDSQSSKINLPSVSSSSSTNGTQVTSIELKNVLNAVALQKSNHQVAEPSLPIGPAQRQETMIDTALDLDSLDGSQVGLMKTL